jgi:hypothetical protein
MNYLHRAPAVYHRGLFLWAVLTALVCFPLVFMGGLVTSTGVGMVDDTWKFTPFLLFTRAGLEQVWNHRGMLIEHGHRQLGFIVGMMAIVLALWCGFAERGGRRWLGLLALAAVAAQGALGAARILFNPERGVLAPELGRDYALIHGILGQLVFTLLVLVALVLSRSWLAGATVETMQPGKLRRLCQLTALLATLQLAAGAGLRHLGGAVLLWVHLLLASAILVHVILVLARTATQASGLLARPAIGLALLLFVQLALGVLTWWFGGGTPMADLTPRQLDHRAPLATAHQAVGALFLALTWLLALRARRHLAAGVNATVNAPRALEKVPA